MKYMTLMITSSLLAACSYLPGKEAADNRASVKVDCSGAVGWEECFRKADSHCRTGFDIFNKEENMVTGLRSLTFACKK